MTTTPSATAQRLASQLESMLNAIYDEYTTKSGELVEQVEHEVFDEARQHLADIEHIQDRAAAVIDSFNLSSRRAADEIYTGIADIVEMWPLYNTLQDRDPILVAEEMIWLAALDARFGGDR